MNRTGLVIALGLTAIIGLLFGIFPEWDLKFSALFYNSESRTFPLKINTLAVIARNGAMWIAWALALPALIAMLVKFARPDRRLMMSGRAIVFLLITLLLGAGILSNLAFKSHWGRPRPVVVTQFDGAMPFVPWWDPRGTCRINRGLRYAESELGGARSADVLQQGEAFTDAAMRRAGGTGLASPDNLGTLQRTLGG